jgi:hypothetical protein
MLMAFLCLQAICMYANNHKDNSMNNGFITAKELMQINSEKKQRLDSIISKDQDNNCNYSKQIFSYYDNNFPEISYNYVWDGSANYWKLTMTSGYKWDKSGNCLEDYTQQSDFGTKYIRTFDNNNRLVSLETYYYGENGQWSPSSKEEYKYDEAGRLLSTINNYFNSTDSVWYAWTKIESTYDNNGNLTSYTSYKMKNGEWTGSGSRKLMTYDNDNNLLTTEIFDWNSSSSKWIDYTMETNTYEDGLLEYYEKQYWNKTDDNWNGTSSKKNMRTDYFYDKQKRDTLETNSSFINNKWVIQNKYCNQYNDLENGDLMRTYTEIGYNTSDDGVSNATPNLRKIYVYTPTKKVRTELDQTYSENWINTQMDSISYTNNDSVDEEFVYAYNYSSKVCSQYIKHTYNEAGKETEQLVQILDPTNPDILTNYTDDTFKYVNDTIYAGSVKNIWKYGQWCYAVEYTYEYDLSIPYDELMTFGENFTNGKPIKNKITSKVIKTSSTQPVVKHDYFYSDNIQTSISSTELKDNSNGIYYDAANQSLYTNSNVVISVYSINGTHLLSTKGQRISVKNLPKGIYIAETNNQHIKFIKK